MKKENLLLMRKILALVIDWNIILILSVPCLFISPNFDINYLKHPNLDMFSVQGILLFLFCFFVLPLLQDLIFGNASLGKFLLGLKVVDSETLENACFWKKVLRNITFWDHYVDIILLLITKQKTLGDLIAKTKVINRK